MATSTPVTTPSATTPTQWNVTPDQTVAGNVQNIIADNSPLMQQAATQAAQTMNQRGLINSSMAVGAGQGALYSAAVTMATTDAATNAAREALK